MMISIPAGSVIPLESVRFSPEDIAPLMGTRSCEATGCTAPAVGHVVELHEVPRWRCQASEADLQVFEPIRLSYFCEAHQAAAVDESIAPAVRRLSENDRPGGSL